MLRNIPNNYTERSSPDELNSFRGAFDFVCLPLDFESERNMGHEFINFFWTSMLVSAVRNFLMVSMPGFSSAMR